MDNITPAKIKTSQCIYHKPQQYQENERQTHHKFNCKIFKSHLSCLHKSNKNSHYAIENHFCFCFRKQPTHQKSIARTLPHSLVKVSTVTAVQPLNAARQNIATIQLPKRRLICTTRLRNKDERLTKRRAIWTMRVRVLGLGRVVSWQNKMWQHTADVMQWDNWAI